MIYIEEKTQIKEEKPFKGLKQIRGQTINYNS